MGERHTELTASSFPAVRRGRADPSCGHRGAGPALSPVQAGGQAPRAHRRECLAPGRQALDSSCPCRGAPGPDAGPFSLPDMGGPRHLLSQGLSSSCTGHPATPMSAQAPATTRASEPGHMGRRPTGITARGLQPHSTALCPELPRQGRPQHWELPGDTRQTGQESNSWNWKDPGRMVLGWTRESGPQAGPEGAEGDTAQTSEEGAPLAGRMKRSPRPPPFCRQNN